MTKYISYEEAPPDEGRIIKWTGFVAGEARNRPPPSLYNVSATMGSVAFASSFFSGRHSTGKEWASLFLPTSSTGGSGLSITWWAGAGKKGQLQIKGVSERDWYTQVGSKLSKGYGCISYMGTSVPLKKGHEFVRELSDRTTDSMPMMGVAGSEWAIRPYSDIFRDMVVALSRVEPIRSFLKQMAALGHNISYELGNCRYDGAEDSQMAVAWMTHLDDATLTTPAFVKDPAPDRKESYGESWGAFG